MGFNIFNIEWEESSQLKTGQIVLPDEIDNVEDAQSWCANEGFENTTVVDKATSISNARGGGVIRPNSSGGRPI